MASWKSRLSTAWECADCFQPSSIARWQSPQNSALLGTGRSAAHMGVIPTIRAIAQQSPRDTLHLLRISEGLGAKRGLVSVQIQPMLRADCTTVVDINNCISASLRHNARAAQRNAM